MDELFAFVKGGIAREKGRWRDLANRSGVSYSLISKLGAGKYEQTNIGYRTLERLASALRDEASPRHP